jgi:hypothetical protein
MSPDSYLRCPRCSDVLPERSLVTLCVNCCNQVYMEETLAHEGDLISDLDTLKIEVAQDKKHVRHIALLGDHELAYCGIRPVRTPMKRQRFLVRDMPPGVCSLCLGRFGKTIQKFKERVA